MKSKNWFEVSKEGLRSLQEGKPKHFVVRELVQNAWDEDISYCEVNISNGRGKINVSVRDDSPEGFRDLTDAYTLFKHTYKRAESQKRGRFNVGEKQVLAICDKAVVRTTKGTVVFDKIGRHKTRARTEKGSEVEVEFRGNEQDRKDIQESVRSYLVPKGIQFTVNGEPFHYREPLKVIEVNLQTEIEMNGVMRKTNRKTRVHVLEAVGKARLYEMGIPVCEIECQFDIDVQQKVPLSIDRETVSQRYLSDLYAEVLNVTWDRVEEEKSSALWIREASGNKRIEKEAVRDIMTKRFGEKVCVANSFDPNSVDDAISNGYRVVRGSELSSEEWANIKRDDLLRSSSDLFGKSFVGAEVVEPTTEQERVAELAKKIAKRLLQIDLEVCFTKSKATAGADFGNDVLTFNVSRLPKSFWQDPVSSEVLDLILHELAHSRGNHTEMSYHQCITRMAGALVMVAIEEPEFFEGGD